MANEICFGQGKILDEASLSKTDECRSTVCAWARAETPNTELHAHFCTKKCAFCSQICTKALTLACIIAATKPPECTSTSVFTQITCQFFRLTREFLSQMYTCRLPQFVSRVGIKFFFCQNAPKNLHKKQAQNGDSRRDISESLCFHRYLSQKKSFSVFCSAEFCPQIIAPNWTSTIKEE